MVELTNLIFADGRVRPSVSVDHPDDLPPALELLGLASPRPTLLLVGGASGLDDRVGASLADVFETLTTQAERAGAVVVDGGTDAGVMRLMGSARAGAKASFPLVGVAASGTVMLPPTHAEAPVARSPLEPNHTHFLLVPGDDWGAEAPWLVAVAREVAGARPRLGVLVNGGDIAVTDVRLSTASKCRVVVIAGSGGLADDIARAARGESSPPVAKELAASPFVVVVTDVESLQRELLVLSR